MTMFIWLTNPTIGQVLVNFNLVSAVTCVQGRNTVCFTGGEEDYIVVMESLEDIYERIQSAEKRYRK
jgi:acetyl-CoA carboxylase beta subunit